MAIIYCKSCGSPFRFAGGSKICRLCSGQTRGSASTTTESLAALVRRATQSGVLTSAPLYH